MQRYEIENKDFQHECRIRDFYTQHLSSERPNELRVSTEQGYSGSLLRADLRTVDKNNLLREWEFKIWADYRALGQILTYVALARHRENFTQKFHVLLHPAKNRSAVLKLSAMMVSAGLALSALGNVALSAM